MDYREQWSRCRIAGVPLVAIETQDQPATIRWIVEHAGDMPVMIWDIVRGATEGNQAGAELVGFVLNGQPSAAVKMPSELLGRLWSAANRGTPVVKDAIVIMINAHRVCSEPAVATGVGLMREVGKREGVTVVLLAPEIKLTPELSQDVVVISETLPEAAQIESIVTGICQDAGAEIPANIERVCDVLAGLSAFAAEQTVATCMRRVEGRIEIDTAALWERKCQAVEATPGLSIYRGTETFADLGGCGEVKTCLRRIITGRNAPQAIVFFDEIEKALSGATGDTSGVSQDQLGVLLSYMQDHEVQGMLFIGPPGAAKSAICKAAGNEAEVPTVAFDLGGMKASLVGQSGQQTRTALKVVSAVSRGRALFIATCNSIGVLPPELRRRFQLTYFFDLPDEEERTAIWPIYERKYNVSGPRPEDTGWTGAEIKQCCKLAADMGITLIDAGAYIVPVSQSAADVIETLRSSAAGKFLDASRPGVYRKRETKASGRKMRVGVGAYDA